MISVIVPVYNSEKYILSTLESILDQTLLPKEIIIVDDGSTDQTYSLLSEYVKENKLQQLVYLIRERNGGPSIARNLGLKRASGKFVQFFDGDDIMHPRKLEISHRLTIQYQIDAVVTDFTRFSGRLHKMNEVELNFNNLLIENTALEIILRQGVGAPRALYRKSFLSRVGGFNEKLINNEDHELNFRLICEGAKFLYAPISLMYYRQHDSPDRITRLDKRYIQSIEASKVILKQLSNLENPALRDLVVQCQASKIAYASLNLLRLGDFATGDENLRFAKSLSSDLIVSRSSIYNAVSKILGLGRIDRILGRIRKLL